MRYTLRFTGDMPELTVHQDRSRYMYDAVQLPFPPPYDTSGQPILPANSFDRKDSDREHGDEPQSR